MSVTISEPTKTITAYNDETFTTQADAVECANWLGNEYGDDAAEMFVFEKEENIWVVAW